LDDAVDWLTGLQSRSYLEDVLRETRRLNEAQGRERARRGAYFAGAAVDFVEAARDAKPSVAFLPAYYAYLNMCKLVIACSDRSEEVEGGIQHGVSYPVSLKNSQTLFTEVLLLQEHGVFPVLYELLTGRPLPLHKKKKRRQRAIQLQAVYSRMLGVSAEFSQSQGDAATRLCRLQDNGVHPVSGGEPSFVWKLSCHTIHGGRLDEDSILPPLPGWRRTVENPLEWVSPPQSVATHLLFEREAAIDRRFLSLPYPMSRRDGLFALPEGKLCFPDEVPIFLALYHLSSVVRYKPRFLETIQDSNAWPLVLATRRHMLYRGIVLTISSVLQKSAFIRVASNPFS
jgi:hypothetical protein